MLPLASNLQKENQIKSLHNKIDSNPHLVLQNWHQRLQTRDQLDRGARSVGAVFGKSIHKCVESFSCANQVVFLTALIKKESSTCLQNYFTIKTGCTIGSKILTRISGDIFAEKLSLQMAEMLASTL